MNNRDKRKIVLTKAFQRVQDFVDTDYVVTWDDDKVTKVNFDNGVELEHGKYCKSGIFTYEDEYDDMSCLTIPKINKELKERLQIWKKVEIKL